tara:strand:- start:1859 stop:4804 length:2946 start_codon:yes stop_codon:yes gene_type:complete
MARENCPDPIGTTTTGTGADDGVGTNGSVDVFEDPAQTPPTPRNRSVGKFRVFHDSEIYHVRDFSENSQEATPGAQGKAEKGPWHLYENNVADRFRYVSQCHWGKSYQDLEDQPNYGYIYSGFLTEKVPGIPYTLRTITNPEPDLAASGFLADFATMQDIFLEADEEHFQLFNQGFQIWGFATALWESFIMGGDAVSGVSEPESYTDKDSRVLPPLFERNVDFEDHAFRINVPLFPHEVANVNNMTKPAIADVKAEYNFYIAEYENQLRDLRFKGELKEQLLPNMYAFLFEKKSKNLDRDNSIYHRLITLDGHIDNVSKDILVQNPYGRGEVHKVGEKDHGQYYEKWSRGYSAFINTARTTGMVDGEFTAGSVRMLKLRYSNMVFSPNDMELLNSFNEKRFLFPMYVDFQFSTDRTTLLAEAINEAQLTRPLMRTAVETNISNFSSRIWVEAMGAKYDRTTLEDRFSGGSILHFTDEETVDHWNWGAWHFRKNFNIASENYLIDGDRSNKVVTTALNQPTNLIDLERWYEVYKEIGSKVNLNERLNQGVPNTEIAKVIFDTGIQDSFADADNQYDFARAVYSLIFSGKFRNIVKDRLRNFQDVLEGKFAYSETVFYKVAKHKIIGGETSEDPIQEFFFPNSSKIDVLRFIDTQVDYGAQYKYIIYAFELVFGTKYYYTNSFFDEPDRKIDRVDHPMVEGRGARFRVRMRPSIKIAEVPIFETTVVVNDRPPLSPDVDIIPYFSTSDKIKFNFNHNVGEAKGDLIPLTTADSNLISIIRREQRLQAGEPINFKGDDHVEFFEIYRIKWWPTSYDDFKGARIAQVETSLNFETGLRANSAAYIDNIQKNRKYYYIFRTIDVHGLFSNPSAVYEVELIDDGGAIWPSIRSVEFPEMDNKKQKRKFKKYILIQPSIEQGQLDVDDVRLTEASTAVRAVPKFGIMDQALFGSYTSPKKFKVRITSRHTGKKIDLNIKFAHKHNNNT